MAGWNPRRMVLLSMVMLPLVGHPAAYATVYSWKGTGGVLMMSNDPADVPADQQASAQQFTSKPAPRPAPDLAGAADPPGAAAAALDAYERGFDAGLQASERQVAVAAELVRAAQAAVPQTPPAPIVIEQSPPIAPQAASYYPSPYYGYGGYYPPYFPYGFAVGFVPHRPFFPGFRGSRFGSFFPHGQFSRVSIGRMR